MSYWTRMYGINGMVMKFKRFYFKIKIKECDIQTVTMINELQDAMQDDAVINVVSKQEMDDILHSICYD